MYHRKFKMTIFGADINNMSSNMCGLVTNFVHAVNPRDALTDAYQVYTCSLFTPTTITYSRTFSPQTLAHTPRCMWMCKTSDTRTLGSFSSVCSHVEYQHSRIETTHLPRGNVWHVASRCTQSPPSGFCRLAISWNCGRTSNSGGSWRVHTSWSAARTLLTM